MAYLSLYRRYRAQAFDELMGQDHITTTLRNAIRQGRWSHAYLFCGPRGTGKTTTARLLAKSLNCEQGPTPDPCNQCRFCEAIRLGALVDVVEMDAASETSIDDVRSGVIENAKYPPMEARFKIYIIDEAHDLSAKAFDALLKTIEEPPPHVLFILATTEFTKVPPTIRSRCQRFDFHRGTITDIVKRIEQVVQAEGIEAEPAVLNLVARAADGSWRDALTALEQVIAFSDSNLTLESAYQALGVVEDETLHQLIDALHERQPAQVLTLLEAQLKRGREPRVFVESFIAHLRALIQIALNAPGSQTFYDPAQQAAMYEQATRVTPHRLLNWWEKLTDALNQMRASGAPRALLELCLLRLCEGDPAPMASPPPARRESQASQPAQQKPTLTVVTHVDPEPTLSRPSETISNAPGPVSGAFTCEGETGEENDLDRWWSVYVQRTKEKSPRLGAALEGSQLVINQGNQVTLLVRSELTAETFSKDDKRSKVIAEAIAKQLNLPNILLKFSANGAAAPPPSVPVEPEEVSPTLEGEHLVETIKATFNGQEIGGM